MVKQTDFLDFLQHLSSTDNPDNVFIPKTLVSRSDIGEDAKMLFADIYTENRFGTLDELKAALNDVSDDTIEAYALNGSAEKLKSDWSMIYDELEQILLLSPASKH